MITAAVAPVPRLNCRYQSLSRQLEIVSFPDFLRRYRTALSANVALTSTTTRTKPPQAADPVPPANTTTYELLRIPPRVAGSVSGHHKQPAAQIRWYRTCTAFCAFLISMPVPAQANATTRRGQTFHQAHILVPKRPACQNTHLARWGSSKAAMQAPGRRKAHVSYCLGRRRTSYLRAFPFRVRSMRPGSSKDSMSLPRCHGSPGKHRSATKSSIAGSSALRAMTCMLQPFCSRLNGRALAQTPVPLSFEDHG